MSNDNDLQNDAWFEILAGRSTPDADPKTRREAGLLRMAILMREQRLPRADVSELSEAAINTSWKQLSARLRTEGLLGPSKKPPAKPVQLPVKPSLWQSLRNFFEMRPPLVVSFGSGFATAAVLLMGLAVLPNSPQDLESGTRGVREGLTGISPSPLSGIPQIHYADDPSQSARAFTAALEKLQLKPRLSEREDGWLVEVSIQQPGLEALLNQYELSLVNARLVVLFTPSRGSVR